MVPYSELSMHFEICTEDGILFFTDATGRSYLALRRDHRELGSWHAVSDDAKRGPWIPPGVQPGTYHILAFTPISLGERRELLDLNLSASDKLDEAARCIRERSDDHWLVCLGPEGCISETPVTRQQLKALDYL